MCQTYGGICSCQILSQITFVDFVLYELLDQHRVFDANLLDGCDNIKVTVYEFVCSRLAGIYFLYCLYAQVVEELVALLICFYSALSCTHAHTIM